MLPARPLAGIRRLLTLPEYHSHLTAAIARKRSIQGRCWEWYWMNQGRVDCRSHGRHVQWKKWPWILFSALQGRSDNLSYEPIHIHWWCAILMLAESTCTILSSLSSYMARSSCQLLMHYCTCINWVGLCTDVIGISLFLVSWSLGWMFTSFLIIIFMRFRHHEVLIVQCM